MHRIVCCCSGEFCNCVPENSFADITFRVVFCALLLLATAATSATATSSAAAASSPVASVASRAAAASSKASLLVLLRLDNLVDDLVGHAQVLDLLGRI